MGQNFENTISAKAVGTDAVVQQATAIRELAQSVAGLTDASKKVQTPRYEQFAANVKGFIQAPLETAGSAAEGLLLKMGPVGAVSTVAAAGLGAVAAQGFAAMKSLGSFGDEIEDTMSRLGMSAKEVGEFRFAMKYAGSDIGALEGIMRRLSPEIESGGKNLRAMGVEFRNTRTGELLPMSQVLVSLAERLAALPEGPIRNAAAIKVMGRAALEVLPDLMELPEGLRVAEEKQKGYSKEQLARWKEYQHEVVSIESAWESLKRSMKEPLAAVVHAIIQGPEGGDSASNAAMRGMFGRTDQRDMTAVELQKVLQARAKADADLMRGAASAADPFVIKGNALIDAVLGSTPEEKLEMAKTKLSELRAKVEQLRGTADSVSEKVRGDYAAQRAEVERLEAAVKSAQERMAKGRSLAAFERKATGEGEGAVSKWFTEAAGLGWSPESRSRAWTAAFQGASAELTQQEEKGYKALDIPARAAEYWAKSAKAAEDELDKSTSDFVKQWLAQAKPIAEANRQIDDILFGSERAEIIARSGKASRMAELAAGPGQEASAIDAAYRERLRLARELYNLDMGRASKESDINKARVDEAKAEADLHKELYEADIERELSLSELRKQHLEEYKSLAVSGFEALVSGGRSGFGSFARSQAMAIASKVVGNAAGMTYDSLSGKLTLPGQGTADKPTWLGKMLSGTPLGLDPLKAATDANTLATVANTAALRGAGGGGPGAGGIGALFGGGAAGGGDVWITDETGALVNVGGGGTGPGASGMRWAKYLGAGAALAGGTYGIYSGVQSGGARGALTAAGSAAGMAGALLPMIASTLKMAGPIGMAAGMGLGLLAGIMPDRKQRRIEEMDREREDRAVTLPAGRDYVTDLYGRNVEYDYTGRMRPVVVNQTIHQTVQAWDSKSLAQFLRENPEALSAGMTGAVASDNGEDLLATLRERL